MWLLYQHYLHENHLGGRALENTYFPQSHSRHTSRMCVKCFTKFSKVKLDNFYANFWDWTGTRVGRPYETQIPVIVPSEETLGTSVSLSDRGRFCPPLVARLQEAEINKCKVLGRAKLPD